MKFSNQSHLHLEEYLSVLRERAAIGVVYSANPDEEGSVVERTFNPRSWKSYREVAEQITKTLKLNGFKTVELLAEGPELRQAIATKKFNLFWLNTAGIQGRGSMSHAASQLESLGFPYVGHAPLQGTLLDDKILMKQWLKGVGLPTAPFIVRQGGGKTTVTKHDPDYAREFGTTFEGPFVVKPALGRGSVDIKVVENLIELDSAIASISNHSQDRVLVEPLLLGQEYCVWGSRGIIVQGGKLISKQATLCFGHSERLFNLKNKIYLKENNSSIIADPCRPLSSTEDTLRDDLSFLAQTIIRGLGLFLPVRLDLRLGLDGLLSILEVNPKPDLKQPMLNETGLLSAALQDLNCTFDDFILKILFDWLDYHLLVSPSSLSMLLPLFERYTSLPVEKAVARRKT